MVRFEDLIDLWQNFIQNDDEPLDIWVLLMEPGKGLFPRFPRP